MKPNAKRCRTKKQILEDKGKAAKLQEEIESKIKDYYNMKEVVDNINKDMEDASKLHNQCQVLINQGVLEVDA